MKSLYLVISCKFCFKWSMVVLSFPLCISYYFIFSGMLYLSDNCSDNLFIYFLSCWFSLSFSLSWIMVYAAESSAFLALSASLFICYCMVYLSLSMWWYVSWFLFLSLKRFSSLSWRFSFNSWTWSFNYFI